MLFLLKSLNFFVSLLTLKHEIDSRPKYIGEYLLKSGTININRIILDNLHSVLRNEVVFISTGNTESLFRDDYDCKGDPSLVMFSKGNRKFTNKIILLESIPLLDKSRIYFFIDSQTRKYIPLFREYDLECVDFEYSLNYFKGSTIVDIFIGLYRKISNCKMISNLIGNVINNLKYGDTQFIITVYKNFKEMKLTNYHIGTIHQTQYYVYNSFYNKIELHFVEFYSNNNDDVSFLDLSEKYINSLLDLMVKKGILHKDIKNKEGVIEDLFPFEFYKGITQNLEENTFITGGICFDRILKNNRLGKFVNKEKIKKLGTRFIMTGCLRKSKNKMYVEMIYKG